MTSLEAKDVKPSKKGKSDFYSWQLYRWLREKPDYNHVYKGAWNCINGYDQQRRTLYIGRMEDSCFLGTALRRLCHYGAKLESWAYCSEGHRLDEWEDTTESFIAEYMTKGVCAIHGDVAHKWRYVPSAGIRTCDYCGKEEKRNLVFVPKTVWMPC